MGPADELQANYTMTLYCIDLITGIFPGRILLRGAAAAAAAMRAEESVTIGNLPTKAS